MVAGVTRQLWGPAAESTSGGGSSQQSGSRHVAPGNNISYGARVQLMP